MLYGVQEWNGCSDLCILLWFCSLLVASIWAVIYNLGNLKLWSGSLIVPKWVMIQFCQCSGRVLRYLAFQTLTVGGARQRSSIWKAQLCGKALTVLSGPQCSTAQHCRALRWTEVLDQTSKVSVPHNEKQECFLQWEKHYKEQLE